MGIADTLLKNAFISTVRRSTRAYIRAAPWSLGKSSAKRAFDLYVGWRPHRQVVRTRFGDLMDISLPDGISATILLAGHWEPSITAYVRSALRSGDTFIDVGANIGYYSVLASGLVGDCGRVFSIEAHPRIYQKLTRNIALNKRVNVQTINAAVSGDKGELPIFLGPAINPGHTTTVADLAQREGLRFDGTVPADTLESLVGADTLYKSRLIKVDVEGAEHSVLSPLFGSLHRFSLSTEWLLELDPEFCPGGQNAIDEIYTAFSQAGYRAFSMHQIGAAAIVRPSNDAQLKAVSEELRHRHCDVLMTRRAH